MKYSLVAPIAISAFLMSAMVSFAAGVTLQNGGLGQLAGNDQNFGVAVCNGGASAVSQSVPISVEANGQTATILSQAPIASGACAYSYLSYSQLDMQANTTYSVTATIDPGRTLITNNDNQTAYTITVPETPPTAAQTSNSGTGIADVGSQSGNFFTMIANFFLGLFRTN